MWVYKDNELQHHGVKGMKWGVRRYQNPDGSLTAAGKKRMNNIADSKIRSKVHTWDAKSVYRSNLIKTKVYGKLADTFGHEEKAKEYIARSDVLKKKISDIDDGVTKAGHDFMVKVSKTPTGYRYTVIEAKKEK